MGLGAVLIVVAVAGGLVGVANTRTEQTAATKTNGYLVLQPAARDLRTSVSEFQLIAEQAFADPATERTAIASAVQKSTETDQAYLDLSHLLGQPANAGIAPGLARLEKAYVESRTGLATLLATGASTQTAQIAGRERTAYTRLDAAVDTLQATITARLVRTANEASAAAKTARDDLLAFLVAGGAFGIAATTVLARKAFQIERDTARRDAITDRVTVRNEFEGRLQRALEMATSETPVFDVIAQALGSAAPSMRTELLLADSSRAHFRQVLVTPPETDEVGCGVISPSDCPAASRGQTMVFESSLAMDTCPHLRGRDRSALCVPVSISGNSAGVVHVTSAEGCPPADAVSRDIEVVARPRLGTPRHAASLRSVPDAGQQRLADWPVDEAEHSEPSSRPRGGGRGLFGRLRGFGPFQEAQRRFRTRRR